MKDYLILTDTSCNLEKKYREQYGIEVVSMHYLLNNEDHLADNDWQSINAKDFYDTIRQGTRITTSQVDENQYEEKFIQCAKENKDVLVLACSNALSSSINEAKRAREEVLSKYDNIRIEIVDSVCACYTLGMLAMEVAKLKQSGANLDEALNYALEERYTFLEVGYADQLKYLRQAGRVSAAAAFFGSIIGVRPIIIFDREGHNVAVKKAKGRKAAHQICADYIKEYGLFDKVDTIYLAHADCLDDANELIEVLKENLQNDKIKYHCNYVEPAIGASVGPGTIIIGFKGKKEMRG